MTVENLLEKYHSRAADIQHNIEGIETDLSWLDRDIKFIEYRPRWR